MADEAGGHVPLTRRQWDERMSAWFERYAHPRWAATEPYWGMWCIPQSRLPVLPGNLAGATAVELGCGTAYVSAWLARRGARPVAVDISARQPATACRMQAEFGLRFPLVHGDAERVPLAAACADLVISEYGASLWCDPYRWIPEAARLLRPGGRLVFMAESTLARMCLPEEGPATERLARDLFGLHQVVRRGSSGTTYRQFTLPHGERIRFMAGCGLVVEDLIEVQVPPGAANNDFPEYPDEWVRRWPAEEIWFARRRLPARDMRIRRRPGDHRPRPPAPDHACPVTSKIPQRMPLTCKEESVLSIVGRHRVRFDRFVDRSGTSRDNEVCPLASLADRLSRLSSCVNVSASSLSAAA